MTWTKEYPERAGHWWFREIRADGSKCAPEILKVFWVAPWGRQHEYGGYWAWSYGPESDDHEQVDNLKGEWSSEPIPEPVERTRGSGD